MNVIDLAVLLGFWLNEPSLDGTVVMSVVTGFINGTTTAQYIHASRFHGCMKVSHWLGVSVIALPVGCLVAFFSGFSGMPGDGYDTLAYSVGIVIVGVPCGYIAVLECSGRPFHADGRKALNLF